MNTLPTRRQMLAAALAAPAFLRHARAADVPRFALGVASGHPRADTLVLWTRLTGADLPAQVPVRWELAHDEQFQQVVASGTEMAEAGWAHSVHAEPQGLQPARGYWYRFSALGQQSRAGRTRTAPAPDAAVARLRFAIASCQRWDTGFYAAWAHAAREELDVMLFLGDYIYEYGSRPGAPRAHEGGKVRSLAQYRARYAQYKGDEALQAAHAALPWIMVWDDHEVDNDHAGLQGQDLQPDFEAQRAAAYQAYWEHMPFPKALRPRGPDMRIVNRFDWGRLARIHAVDDRQYRDAQACPKPGKGGSNTLRAKDCPALADPQRTLLGAAQERWLEEGWDSERGWNLLAQQTLMARCSWTDPADPTYWTDGWDGYAPARQRLLDGVARRGLKNVVVLGGDVHTNYVANLLADFDKPDSAVLATEFCGTSITSLSLPQSRLDGMRGFNPHLLYARGDQRGYMRFDADAKSIQVDLRVVDDALDPQSAIGTAARFAVEAGRPGALKA